MSKISSEFILGSAIGYFFSNNLFVFTLGLVSGVVIQENFGSLYKFSEFCFDSSKELLKQNLSKIMGKFGRANNENLSKKDVINNMVDEINNDSNNDSNIVNANGLKNKED